MLYIVLSPMRLLEVSQYWTPIPLIVTIEIVSEARDQILNFMTADDTKLVPGFLGHHKIDGTVFINLRLNKVGFRDNNGYRFRTAMTMNDKKILELANRDFHLFPDAGKP